MQVRHHGNHELMRLLITVHMKTPHAKKINVKNVSACNFIYYDESFQTIIRCAMANNRKHPIESRERRNLVYKVRMKLTFQMQILAVTVENPYMTMWTQFHFLSPRLLSKHQELRPAHLTLEFIRIEYVWQEGQHAPAQVKHNNAMRNCKNLWCYICWQHGEAILYFGTGSLCFQLNANVNVNMVLRYVFFQCIFV